MNEGADARLNEGVSEKAPAGQIIEKAGFRKARM
jgi:hypothetical protein